MSSEKSDSHELDAGQSSELILTELRSLASSVQSVSDRVDRLSDTVYGQPEKRSLAESKAIEAADGPSTKKSRAESRSWADTLEDLPVPHWDNEDGEPDCFAPLSEHYESLLSAAFSSSLNNGERRKIRNNFPPPRVQQTRCPRLDPLSAKADAKSNDAELARLQAFVLDPVGPLVDLLNGLDNPEYTMEQARSATTEALRLLGNASSLISRCRRKRILRSVNPDIQDLAEEEGHFKSSAPNLFGSGFEVKMKDRAESVKILSKAAFGSSANRKFFRGGRPTAPQRGGGQSNRGRSTKPWAQRGLSTGNNFHNNEPCSRQRPVKILLSRSIIVNLLVQRGVKFLASQSVSPVAGRLIQQLGSSVSRPMCPEHNPGIQNSFPRGAFSNFTPEVGHPVSSGAESHSGGAPVNASERGCNGATPVRGNSGVLLQPVPKKDGGMRPVINLKSLNEFIAPHHFIMEGIHTLKQKGDWMTIVDLKDAYFMIPIHQSDRQYLRFSVQSRHFQFNCLPFGLSCAPWVFTKTLKPVISQLRELGVRLVVYIDDILIMAESEELARDQTLGLTYLLENLGFIIHSVKKVTTPTQQIEFLGMQVHSQALELHLPGQKIRKLRSETAKLQDLIAPPTAREVSRLLGKLNSVSQAVPYSAE